MRLCFILFFLVPLAFADGERGSLGLMSGVAKLSHNGDSASGPSTLFHFDYTPDGLLGFFGEAGVARADELKQKIFSGGASFALLPITDLRVGFATAVNEFVENGSEKRESELGPLAGLTVHTDIGNWRFGTSGTIIRTASIQTVAFHLMLLLNL